MPRAQFDLSNGYQCNQLCPPISLLTSYFPFILELVTKTFR